MLGLGGGYLCFHWDIHHRLRKLCIVTSSHSKGFNKGNKMSRMKDYLLEDLPLFRATDPDTSRQIKPIRINSHRGILLAIYAGNISGLTDEEAAEIAASRGHVINGYWKRCADLRTQGLIHDLGVRKTLKTGSQGMVCAITRFGLDIATGCYD